MLPLAIAVALTAQCQQPPLKFLRWEKEIAGIEKRLADKPPAKGGVVFAGSSSIRLWDLPKSFPDSPPVNVGFGGSTIPDCTVFVSRLVLPFEPKTVVFYAGENDIAGGRTPEQVADDFAAFAAAVHAKLPRCRILFLAVKPSPSRWGMYEKQQKANALVKGVCDGNAKLRYVDVVPAMLGPDGKPLPELFVKDGLHLSPAGYARWTAAVAAALER